MTDIQSIATEQQKPHVFNLLNSIGAQDLNNKQPQLKRKKHISKWKETPYFINKSSVVTPVVQGGDYA